jgi:hypothetical protein
MRLDNYSVAAFEAFEPVHGDADAPWHGAAEEMPAPESVAAEEAPSQLLAEMARQQPVFVRLPESGPTLRIPRLDDGDRRVMRQHEPEGRLERFVPFEHGDGERGELPSHAPPPPVVETPAPAPTPEPVGAPAPAPVEAATPIDTPAPAAAPATVPAPAAAPVAADAITVALPLGPVVNPGWPQQRETALQAMRGDFEAAREAARAAPPADLALAAGTGWVTAPTDHDGNPVNGAVFVPDAAAAAAASEFVPAWMQREGVGQPAPQGQWLAFDDAAYEQAYRERLAARPEASAGLNQLAQLYGQPVQQLLGAHPELWTLATQQHAVNAGAPPLPGVAMGDARVLGQLDLYLADPFVTQLRTGLGGTPAAPTSGIALEQQRLHGAERYAQLTQLSQAMTAVRQTHAAAMQAARDGGGVGWIEVPLQFGTDPETGWPTGVYQTVSNGDSSEIVRDANGVPVLATQRVFDEAVFTNAWLDQGGLAQQAFERFYGRAHSQIVLQHDNSESGGPSRWVSQPSLDNPAVGLDGWSGVHDTELVRLDLNHVPRLNNDAAVGFDPQLGWVTPRDNIHEKRSFLDKVMPIAMVAFVGWATGGAALAANWGTVGAAAAAGAAASFAGGVINGNLSLKGVLIGAVSGALTAGLTPGLTNTLKDAGLGAASGIAARMTVQGGIQALLGGKFKDGAIAGFASGLAELTSANIGDSIKQAVASGSMSAAEAFAARTFNTMLGSAIRAAGSPDDPAHAFAQDWLGALIQEHLPAPPAQPEPAPEPGGVQTFPVPDPGVVEVTPLPPATAPDDPFLLPPAPHERTPVDDAADMLGVPRDQVINVGLLDDAARSIDVLRGFAEGAGFSILETGEALLEVAKNPAQFMRGVKALLTSPEARQQLGEALVRKLEVDVQMLQDAFSAGDMRGTGQQLGKITTDLAGMAGGVGAIAKLGVSAVSAGGRLVLGAMDNLAEKAMRNVGLFDAAGNALMDFRALSTAQKQVVGEVMGQQAVQRLVPDAQRIGRLPGVGETGIDDLFRVNRPDVDFVVVEYKFGSSQLGKTLDGVQMSDRWLTGGATNYNRILESVSNNVEVADEIAISLTRGRVEKWVVHTDPLGNVTVGLVDANGKFIRQPVSRVLGD